MSLPKVVAPEWDLKIPSSGKKITFRPFLTKEYKTLLHAMEMKDPGLFVNTIVNIIEACTFHKVKVGDVTMFDVDYIFLNIRAKSVGEIIPVRYTCTKEIPKKKLKFDDSDETAESSSEPEFETVHEPCNTRINVELNLGDLKIIFPTDYEQKRVVKINDTMGIKLKAPNFRHFRELLNQHHKKGTDDEFDLDLFENDLIFNCVDVIYDGEKLYIPGKEFKVDDFVNFLNQLPAQSLAQINQFFEDLPYVALHTEITCPVCGNKQVIEITSFEDFFI